jgi:hypothetical protein
MKQTFIFLALVFTIVVARADLVMEFSFPFPILKGNTANTIVKIKGDKIRQDSFLNGQKIFSRIADLKTGDNFILKDSKWITTNSLILPNQTNAAVEKAKWSKIQDTGKTEKVNGYEAKIYILTNLDNVTVTLWVVKNFPDFKKIKKDLVKLDKLNDEKLMPEFSSLSGMPLKLLLSSSTNRVIAIPFTLVSANEESIDDSTFELPKDNPHL